jgi:fused signal recognition particle receptor
MAHEKKGLFARLKQGLTKTRQKFSSSLKSVLTLGRNLDADAIEELVEALITADVGPRAAERMAEDVAAAFHDGRFKSAEDAIAFLKQDIKDSLSGWELAPKWNPNGPTVWLVAGVNGVGKTTSIAKLARWYTEEGKSVLLAAGDTYRAGAVDQIQIWADRIGIDVIKHSAGGDPAAVTFDAMEAAIAREIDLLIIDTAGRLHTKENLMRELEKIERVIKRHIPDAPHEVLLVLDATTGQNAIQQAKLFNESINLTGLILAKLDGTAKGGIVVGMRDQIDLPVKFIGIGEQADDLEPFDPDQFAEALFGE